MAGQAARANRTGQAQLRHTFVRFPWRQLDPPTRERCRDVRPGRRISRPARHRTRCPGVRRARCDRPPPEVVRQEDGGRRGRRRRGCVCDRGRCLGRGAARQQCPDGRGRARAVRSRWWWWFRSRRYAGWSPTWEWSGYAEWRHPGPGDARAGDEWAGDEWSGGSWAGNAGPGIVGPGIVGPGSAGPGSAGAEWNDARPERRQRRDRDELMFRTRVHREPQPPCGRGVRPLASQRHTDSAQVRRRDGAQRGDHDRGMTWEVSEPALSARTPVPSLLITQRSGQ